MSTFGLLPLDRDCVRLKGGGHSLWLENLMHSALIVLGNAGRASRAALSKVEQAKVTICGGLQTVSDRLV